MSLSRRTIMAGAGAAALAACANAQGAVAPTPAETEGPFYPRARPADADMDLTRLAGRAERAAGSVIEVRGRILDAKGRPVPAARVEVWQCNAAGRYAHPADTSAAPLDPNFQGYGDLRTGADGAFRLITIKPAPYAVSPGNVRTPHIHFTVAGARDRLTTQMYFPGEPLNETDMLIRRMGARAEGLISRAVAASEPGAAGFDWDIVLQNG